MVASEASAPSSASAAPAAVREAKGGGDDDDGSWSAWDFKGSYHLAYIKNKFPVPGTQLVRERERIAREEKKRVDRETRLSRLEARFRETEELRGKVREEFELFRGRFGPRHHYLERIGSILEQRGEELRTIEEQRQRELEAFSSEGSGITDTFFAHIREGNLGHIRGAIQCGFAVPNETRRGDGATALAVACETGHVSVVQFLLLQGADPDQRDVKGYAPLHVAWRPYGISPPTYPRTPHFFVVTLLHHSSRHQRTTYTFFGFT